MVGESRMRAIGIVSVAVAISMVGTLRAADARPLAYASGETRVWFVDPVLREVIDSVAVEAPGPIVVSPDGGALYVGSLSEREPFRIYAITTEGRAVAPLVSLTGIPRHLALSPDGRQLWVAQWQHCTEAGSCAGAGISVVDVPTQTVVTTFDQENQGIVGPNGIVVTPNGTKAYFTDVSQSSIGVVNARSLSLSDPIYSTCCLESAIAVSPDGASVSALGNEFGGFVVTIDTASDTVRHDGF